MRSDAFVHDLVALVHVLLEGLGVVVGEVTAPVTLDVHGVGRQVIRKAMRWGKLEHALKEGLLRGGELQRQVGAQRVVVDSLLKLGMVQEALDLGAKQQRAIGCLVVIERLDTKDVTSTKEFVLVLVVNHERVHAAQTVDQVLAPLLVTVYQDFGISVAVEGVAGRLQLGAKLLEVVDLSVEDNRDLAVVARHGLGSSFGKIENRKTTEAKGNVVDDMLAAHIGTTVDDAIHHGRENQLTLFICTGKTDKTAHARSFLLTAQVYCRKDCGS